MIEAADRLAQAAEEFNSAVSHLDELTQAKSPDEFVVTQQIEWAERCRRELVEALTDYRKLRGAL